MTIRRRVYEDGYVREIDPPANLPRSEVVVLQPYGSLFFAAAPVFEAALPAVDEDSRDSVVILRLRGRPISRPSLSASGPAEDGTGMKPC